MTYQFEHEEITNCGNCPCCDNVYGCWLDEVKPSFDKISVDCPLVAISKTETTSCEWCESGIDSASVMSADMMMRFVRPVSYCPNCGRRLEGKA